MADRLARRVLGRSLDELAPGARRLLGLLEQLVEQEAGAQGVARERVEFTRRELRERLALGDTQLKVHLARLVSLELVHMTRGAHGAYTYALAYDSSQAADGGLPRLIDPDQQPDEADRSGSRADWSGAGRPPVSPRSGSATAVAQGENASPNGASAAPAPGSVGPDAEERSRGSSSATPVAVTAATQAG